MESSSISQKLKPGDLVRFNACTRTEIGYAMVLEVKYWGLIREEEVYVKFLNDMSKGWFRSSRFNLISRGNEDDEQAQF